MSKPKITVADIRSLLERANARFRVVLVNESDHDTGETTLLACAIAPEEVETEAYNFLQTTLLADESFDPWSWSAWTATEGTEANAFIESCSEIIAGEYIPAVTSEWIALDSLESVAQQLSMVMAAHTAGMNAYAAAMDAMAVPPAWEISATVTSESSLEVLLPGTTITVVDSSSPSEGLEYVQDSCYPEAA